MEGSDPCQTAQVLCHNMLNLFSQSNCFGLDISDLSLKIAAVEKKGKGLQLVSFGECGIPPGVMKEGEVQDEAGLVKAIQQILTQVKGKKIKTKNVVCCLPEEKSFLDVLQLPFLPEGELRQAVSFEAENYIPVPLDEVYFDFEILQPPALSAPVAGQPKIQEILIAATSKRIVDSYFSALKKAGLLPQVMEIEPLAIVRALLKKETSTSPLLLIDFGASRTSFIIFSGSSIRFTSTITVSSQELTLAIAKNLNMPVKRAEKIKQAQGLEGDKEVFDVMIPVLTDLTQQIKTHLDYYRSHVPGVPFARGNGKMERIVLCGAGANLKGLTDFLTSTFKLKVCLADPWVNMEKPDPKNFPNLPSKEFLGYATAFGLAIRGAKL